MPPEIIDSDSSPSTVNIRENYNASLSCKATGIPDPEIIWKREDGRKIVLKRKKKEGKRGKNLLYPDINFIYNIHTWLYYTFQNIIRIMPNLL